MTPSVGDEDVPTRAPGEAHTQQGEVPVRRNVHPVGTEGYRVVATRGGELPEVNNPSVTTEPDEPETT